ncbi:MAG: type I restriction endonuclease subunit R [Methylacidiphilales bacterium]|nr:type I restriction endonuclease subunit R [Candidatus Methylacidiphilales bacterium]NJR14567.1 type I restriction endonuclease subunit R [Calothrix sp. CSU_2_0]
MAQTIGIRKAINNLNEAHKKLNLSQNSQTNFFTEWFDNLPELEESEKNTLNRLKNRYLYYSADGAITEGTVNIIILSPLLELIGLCDPPYKIRSEKLVTIEIENGAEEEETILEGFIDALAIQNQLWIILIESKRYGFSVMQALPQTLAYMSANPNPEIPTFAMITNGEDYIFVKLNQQKQYALSNKFTLANPVKNELYDVMQIIKRIISASIIPLI